jgi:hypothetical protein
MLCVKKHHEMTSQESKPVPAEDDLVMLRSTNSALRTENIRLQREYASLQEQLSALKLELAGRATVAGGPDLTADRALDGQVNQKSEH